MCRTMPPPFGMFHFWNVPVAGSNRTRVFGDTPDSLYHTAPSEVVEMPYGRDARPLGDANSFTCFVLRSRRPKKPRGKSVYHTTSLASTAMRRGRAPSGNRYSVISMVLGSIVAILFVPKRSNTGVPFDRMTMPYGADRGGASLRVMAPVFGSSLPTKLPPCTVNHRTPL